MDAELLRTKFESLGTRLRFEDRRAPFSIDVRTERGGEYFLITVPTGARPDIIALDVRPRDRHLVLMARWARTKDKYLCGHDERHWFVAAIPGRAPVSTVAGAMSALKPAGVRIAEASTHLQGKHRFRRRNAAWVRQGEWFFVPCPGLQIETELILRKEPLVRGRGKPHMAEECVRGGGVTVYVCRAYPNGLTLGQYRKTLDRDLRAARWRWQVMRRDMDVWVRGKIRHPDHKTVVLRQWHKVEMNTETMSRAMRHVAFLD